jgi:CheY-like chemotaxis protein
MSTTPRLLLCIEDDEDDSLWIEEAALEVDPQLIFVNKPNGRDALYFLNRQKEQHYLPCLILLDINMPVMNGKETLAAIKRDPAFNKIPVIVFSTSFHITDVHFCEQHGVELITKPDKVKEFKRKIQHIVLSRCA